MGLANGNTLFAWHEADASGNHQIHYVLLDSSYTLVVPDQVLPNPWSAVNRHVSLTRDAGDNAILTWWSGADHPNYYYALIDHDGVLQTGPTILRTTRYRWGSAMPNGGANGTLPALGLAVTKTAAPDPVSPGGLLTYTLTVENMGLALATGVLITAAVPVPTPFAHAGSGGVLAGDHVEWLSLTVPAGGAISVTWVVTVAPTLIVGASIANVTYGCISVEGASATGTPVTTRVAALPTVIYLPIVLREN